MGHRRRRLGGRARDDRDRHGAGDGGARGGARAAAVRRSPRSRRRHRRPGRGALRPRCARALDRLLACDGRGGAAPVDSGSRAPCHGHAGARAPGRQLRRRGLPVRLHARPRPGACVRRDAARAQARRPARVRHVGAGEPQPVGDRLRSRADRARPARAAAAGRTRPVRARRSRRDQRARARCRLRRGRDRGGAGRVPVRELGGLQPAGDQPRRLAAGDPRAARRRDTRVDRRRGPRAPRAVPNGRRLRAARASRS